LEELNAALQAACRADLQRRVRGSQETVAEKLAGERAQMLELPKADYKACRQHLVTVNPYGLVSLDTNRYSVPGHVGEAVRLRAYVFELEILAGEEVIARHKRCFGQEQDIIDPLHYLQALVQRPGAFEHAVPMRRWRAEWPAVYETLLAELQRRLPDGQGLREFLAILKLHEDYPPEAMAKAIQMALELCAVHRDGVQLCLRQLTTQQDVSPALDLSSRAHLAGIGTQPVDLRQYDALLSGG
jgi:hypothetical protein